MDVESKSTIDEAVDRAHAAVDEAEDRLVSGLHGVLDRLNGTTLKVVEGGVLLSVPPRK